MVPRRNESSAAVSIPLSLLFGAQICVNLSLCDLIQVLRYEFRICDLLTIHNEVGKFRLGSLSRVSFLDEFERQLQRREQHLRFQAEGTYVAQSECRREGYELDHPDLLELAVSTSQFALRSSLVRSA